MLNEILTGKLKSIYSQLNALSNEIQRNLEVVETKIEPQLSIYINGLKKCHLSFNKTLAVLEDSSAFYNKEIEIKDDRNDLDYIRHDLRNPISGMIGYSELILENSSNLSITSSVENISFIANEALELVTEIK